MERNDPPEVLMKLGEISLLSTKFRMPVPRRQYVRRHGLFGKLSGMADYRLTLIRGKAASGKTTLVASYFAEHPELTVRWISLDLQDNQAFSFWYVLASALKDVLDMDEDALKTLFGMVMEPSQLMQVLTLLVNRLCSAAGVMVVLDDFHLMTDTEILSGMDWLLRHLPAQVHLILISRTDPPLYLGDLMIAGQILLLEDDVLRFSEEESRTFLVETLGVCAGEDKLAAMQAVSEGWAGGLQMVALAASGQDYSAGDIRILDKYGTSYFAREIMSSLSQDEQELLVMTSCLPYVSASICNQMTGRLDSAKRLEALADRHLFLSRVQGERDVWRIHGIFGEYLRGCFAATQTAHQNTILSAAAQAAEQDGDAETAASLWMQCGKYPEALRVMSRMGLHYKVWLLLAHVPFDAVRHYPDWVVQKAFFHYYRSEQHILEEMFTKAEALPESDPVVRLLQIARRILYRIDLEQESIRIEEIQAMPLSELTRVIILLKMSVLLYFQCRFTDVLDYLEAAAAMETVAANPYVRISLMSMMSNVKEEMGKLRECEAIQKEFLRMIDTHPVLEHLRVNLYIGVTGIYLKSGRLQEASDALVRARALSQGNGAHQDAGFVYNLMELRILEGRREEALECIYHLLGMEVYQSRLFASPVIRYMLHLDALSPVIREDFLRAYGQCDSGFLRLEDHLTRAKIYDAEGNPGEALALTETLLAQARSQGIGVRLTETLLFRIRLLPHREDTERERRNLLREALFYSAPDHLMLPWMLEGEWLSGELQELLTSRTQDLTQVEKRFAATLTELWRPESRTAGLLSEREQEVLTELSTGATNREIGQRLCISLATVKTHIINIYGKLGAGNRLEAVEKAREAGLLGN